MKTWKLLKSASDKDVITIGSTIVKIETFLSDLNASIFSALSDKVSLQEGLQQKNLRALFQSSGVRSLVDDLCLEDDEPSLAQVLNNPELVTNERITNTSSQLQKTRLQRKREVISGMTGELLQVGGDWKPCKVVVKMHLEIYVEDEEVESLSETSLERSPLDDIRQSLTHPEY